MTNLYQKLLRNTHKFSEEQIRSTQPSTLKQAEAVTRGVIRKRKGGENE